ncbi:MAG: hypothetical protein J6Y83_04815 [Bacteroidales bacterium]|nr:hypothetical protein [Bacteroidales bacterium]
MFTIIKNQAYRIHTFRSGTKKDGEPYALIKLRECDIQPEGLENPSSSKSPINVWLKEVPASLKGIRDGSVIKFVDFDGFSFYREKYDRYGNGNVTYMAGHEIINPTIELVK